MTQQNNIPNPQTIEDCLRIQAHFIGIPRITKRNHKEFYRRGKNLQILNVGWVTKEVDSSMEEGQGRMPSLKEVEDNIGFVCDIFFIWSLEIFVVSVPSFIKFFLLMFMSVVFFSISIS